MNRQRRTVDQRGGSCCRKSSRTCWSLENRGKLSASWTTLARRPVDLFMSWIPSRRKLWWPWRRRSSRWTSASLWLVVSIAFSQIDFRKHYQNKQGDNFHFFDVMYLYSQFTGRYGCVSYRDIIAYQYFRFDIHMVLIDSVSKKYWKTKENWAYWFSATLLPKWPPGGYIGFFGFWTLGGSLSIFSNVLTINLLWLSILTPNFSTTLTLTYI